MTNTIEIIWDHRADHGFAFDVKFLGFRMQHHRGGNAVSCQFEANMIATGRRFGGYNYINKHRAFMPAYAFEGSADDRAAALIGQLEREGWNIVHCGHLPPCLVSDNLKIAA